MKALNASNLVLAHTEADSGHAEPFVTFVLKGTYDVVPGGVCTLAGKQRPILGDRRHMDDIGRSLAWASDLVPFKPHCDFVIHGTFHQPGGIARPEGRASFSFGPLRKELAITGPRTVTQQPGRLPVVSPPEPIAKLPLRWEYSAGGLRDRRNPMGMGQDATETESGEKTWSLPMIEDPGQPIRALSDRPPPANFAPVPPFFQDRRQRLGTRDQRWAMFRAPLAPHDYDESYHNAAPRDQQGGNYPRGDETLILRNMHPKHSDLTTRLPGVAARLAVLRQNGTDVRGEMVAMNLDTVVALPDEDQLVLVWRGRCPIAVRRELDELIWVAAETEPFDAPPSNPNLARRLLMAYQDEQAGLAEKARLAAEAEAKEAAGQAEHAAKTLASVRGLLGTAKLPPNLMKAIETETDPAAVMKLLDTYLNDTLADLARRFPHLADPPGG